MKTQSSDAKERQYIRLDGDDDFTSHRFPDECFEDEDDEFVFLNLDEDDEDEVARKADDRERKDRLIGEVYFIIKAFVASAAVIGILALITRAIFYPFIRKITKDLDW